MGVWPWRLSALSQIRQFRCPDTNLANCSEEGHLCHINHMLWLSGTGLEAAECRAVGIVALSVWTSCEFQGHKKPSALLPFLRWSQCIQKRWGKTQMLIFSLLRVYREMSPFSQKNAQGLMVSCGNCSALVLLPTCIIHKWLLTKEKHWLRALCLRIVT